MPVQDFAELSQKLMTPRVTDVAPELTVADNATTVPAGTEETLLPPEVTVKLVAVAAFD